MITAVDTNILIDVLGADPKFGRASTNALKQSIQNGSIHACEIVWIETAVMFNDKNDFLKAMNTLGLAFSAITQETALLAADQWRFYRRAEGNRERVVADFLIGAHAASQADSLLTRDRGFYRNYFKNLTIIDPMG